MHTNGSFNMAIETLLNCFQILKMFPKFITDGMEDVHGYLRSGKNDWEKVEKIYRYI